MSRRLPRAGALPAASLLLLAACSAQAAGAARRPQGAEATSATTINVVPAVDFERYQGTWYEIARLPNRFQEDCDGEVTATYALRNDGRIDVVNACTRDGRSPLRAEGVARRADEDGPDAKLEVRFAPAFLGWLPFVWGDYWIFELDADYTHALVGSPDGDYLWILAREPQIDAATWDRLQRSIVERGFDVDRLRRTRQRSAISAQ